jgi:CHAT domain-containing protein
MLVSGAQGNLETHMRRNKSSGPPPKHSAASISFCLSLTLLIILGSAAPAFGFSDPQRLIAEADALRATWTESQLREAVGKYDSAATIFTSVSDFSSASLATLNAADVCFDLSEFREALKRYESVAALAVKSHDRFVEGKALSKMARINSYMGNNDLAQTRLNKALGLLKLPEKDPSPLAESAYGEALANTGEVSYSKGNFAKAYDQFNDAISYLGHDRKTRARAHRFIGYISGSLGNANKALSEITQAQELSAQENDRPGEGLALTLLGVFYFVSNDVNAAINLHRKAIDIFRSIGDRHSEAIALNGLGEAYQNLKPDYAQAEFEKSLQLLESIGALDLVAVTAFRLAIFHVKEKHPDLARPYFERCLTLSHALGKFRTEANLLSEIAMVYADQNHPEEARRRFSRVEKFYEKIHDVRGRAIALNNYGDFLLFKLGKKQEALNVYTQALSLSEQVQDPEVLTTSIYNVARCHHALGNNDVALSWIERSLKKIEDLRAGLRTPDWRAAYISHVQQYYELCIRILMDLDRARPGNGFAWRALLVSEKSRARSLLDLVRESQSRSRTGATGDLLRREREVSGMLRSLTEDQLTLSSRGQKDSTEAKRVSNRIVELSTQYQEIQADLRAQQPKQSHLPDFELRDLEQIQEVLRAGDAMLLEYSLGDEQSFLWIVTANSFQSFVLPPRGELEAAAFEVYKLLVARQEFDPFDRDYSAKVDQADDQYPKKAGALSQLVLGPAVEQLENHRTVVLVREGALQFIPFDALPVPLRQTNFSESTASSYLIETNEITAVPSMSTLLTMRAADKRPASPDKVAAVIADPVFSSSDDRVQTGKPSSMAHAEGSADATLDSGSPKVNPPRLIHSSEEADAISASAPYGTVMVAKGFDANRETVMSTRLGDYQILHFATHGFVDAEHPELSSILLTMVDESGRQRDGVMALNDIYNLDLSAQLTVLSACQTALGENLGGEGLVGLPHSFMSAGSRSVVASLWKVDDRATAALMSYFYEFMLKQDLRPAAALRNAKLKLMKAGPRSAPYYWGGFVFQGDYDARIVVERSSHFSVALALLLLVLITGGLILFVRNGPRFGSPT